MYSVSSTLLVTQVLEESKVSSLWQQDIASISSQDLFKQFLDDMQGLSTQACIVFLVPQVLKSKDETLQWDRDEGSSIVSSISKLQFPSPLTISLPCVLPHVGEVSEEENSSWPEVEATWSYS